MLREIWKEASISRPDVSASEPPVPDFRGAEQDGNVREGPSDPGLSLREGRARRPAQAGGLPGQAAT